MRYLRQEQLEFIPKDFQKKIKNKKLVLIGCGGIGSPLAELLVRGGFETLTLIDFDKIDESNLNRQIYFEKNIGKNKAETLKKYLLKINSKVQIKSENIKINKDNINKYCKNTDLIIDATDNFKIRNLINSYSIKNNIDWIYNGAIKTEAVSCIFYSKNNLYEKVFPNSKNIKDEKTNEVGILPSTTFLSASLAYNQILKYFLGEKENKLIKINLWTNQIFEVKLK